MLNRSSRFRASLSFGSDLRLVLAFSQTNIAGSRETSCKSGSNRPKAWLRSNWTCCRISAALLTLALLVAK